MGSGGYDGLTKLNEAGAMVWALITPIFNSLLTMSIDCLEQEAEQLTSPSKVYWM